MWRSRPRILKQSGEMDVRAILLAEPFLKAVSAITYNLWHRRARRALVQAGQFAIGAEAGGAVSLVMQAESEMSQWGSGGMAISTDLHNAFGRVKRGAVLEQVLETIPGAAPYLMLMWSAGSVVLQQLHEGWTEYTVVDGLW